MRLAKLLLMLICATFVICVLITIGMIINQTVTDAISNDNASILLNKDKYKNSVWMRKLHTEAEEIHKGYASIELIANYFGEEIPVPENPEKDNRTNSEFRAELKRVFPQYKIKEYSNLENSKLISTIYDSLAAGNIVILFHSVKKPEKDAQNATEWEMRYTVVIGMDLLKDRITLNDPYGYTLNYSLESLITSARFENYDMEFYESLAFAFKLYSKNKIYVINSGNE